MGEARGTAEDDGDSSDDDKVDMKMLLIPRESDIDKIQKNQITVEVISELKDVETEGSVSSGQDKEKQTKSTGEGEDDDTNKDDIKKDTGSEEQREKKENANEDGKSTTIEDEGKMKEVQNNAIGTNADEGKKDSKVEEVEASSTTDTKISEDLKKKEENTTTLTATAEPDKSAVPGVVSSKEIKDLEKAVSTETQLLDNESLKVDQQDKTVENSKDSVGVDKEESAEIKILDSKKEDSIKIPKSPDKIRNNTDEKEMITIRNFTVTMDEVCHPKVDISL